MDEEKDKDLIAVIESLDKGQLAPMVRELMRTGYQPREMQFSKQHTSNEFELLGVGGDL